MARITNNYVALIAEGAAEQAILDVLIENHLLIYPKEQLLEESVIRTRNARTFAKKYLSYGLEPNQKIDIIRVLDSKNENFKLSPAYQMKIGSIQNLRTSPEIEMLFIVHFDEYKAYLKSKQKPSEFVKQRHSKDIGGNIKSYSVVHKYWSQRPQELIAAISAYNRISNSPTASSLLSIVQAKFLP